MKLNLNKLICCFVAIVSMSSLAQDCTIKVTSDCANESHKRNLPKRGVSHAESQRAWDAVDHIPLESGDSSGGGLEEMWSGSSTSVTNLWGNGDFLINISFGRDNMGGAVWLTVDNSLLIKNVAVPSPHTYKGNFHVIYKNGSFSTESSRAGGSPRILRISKSPTPQYNDCSPGETDRQSYNSCPSGQTLCEGGSKTRSCAANGQWLPWQTRPPVCARPGYYCP